MDAFYRYACGSAADFFITDPCLLQMGVGQNGSMLQRSEGKHGCHKERKRVLFLYSWGMDRYIIYGSKQDGSRFLGFTFWSTPIWGLNRGGARWCSEDPTLAMTGTMASLEQGCMNLLFGITFRLSRLAVRNPLRTAWWQRMKNSWQSERPLHRVI